MDTVLNEFKRPVFSDEPAEVLRRLRSPYPVGWAKVYVGELEKTVTISEYLYQEKWESAVGMLEELLRKKDLPMYQRDPSKLETHIQRTARKILDLGTEKS